MFFLFLWLGVGCLSYANLSNVPFQTAGVSELLASDWNTYVRDNFNAVKFGHLLVADSSERTGLSAAEGTMVYQLDAQKLFVNRDGTSGGWVEVSDLDNAGGVSDVVVPFLAPTGSVTLFAGVSGSVPSGWFVCDGQELAIASFGALYGVCSTNFGALTNGSGGAGTTHFRVPDLRGRVVAGTGTILGSARSVGAVVGSESLPVHAHSMNHDHASFNTSDGAGAHTHFTADNGGAGLRIYTAGQGTGGAANLIAANTSGAGSSENVYSGARYTTSSAGGHNHSIDVPNFTGNTGDAGSGNHGVVQPTIVMNYIIKA